MTAARIRLWGGCKTKAPSELPEENWRERINRQVRDEESAETEQWKREKCHTFRRLMKSIAGVKVGPGIDKATIDGVTFTVSFGFNFWMPPCSPGEYCLCVLAPCAVCQTDWWVPIGDKAGLNRFLKGGPKAIEPLTWCQVCEPNRRA